MNIYIIDTSSLIEMKNRYPIAKVEKPDNLNADPFLIALALVKKELSKKELVAMKLFDKDNVNIDYIIITEESLGSKESKKIPSIGSKESEKSKKIPSICKDLGINCIKLLKMIDLEGWSF
jgi:hypothetical protein